jgi:hypothetical protein
MRIGPLATRHKGNGEGYQGKQDEGKTPDIAIALALSAGWRRTVGGRGTCWQTGRLSRMCAHGVTPWGGWCQQTKRRGKTGARP